MTHTTSLFLALLCNMQRNFMFWTIFLSRFSLCIFAAFFSRVQKTEKIQRIYSNDMENLNVDVVLNRRLLWYLRWLSINTVNTILKSQVLKSALFYILFYFSSVSTNVSAFHVEHTEILIDFIFGNNIWKWCVKTS